jgi:hypothetical protein
MYFDDTFSNAGVKTVFPSYKETCEVMLKTIKELRERYGSKIKICINTAVMGLEPILRNLGNTLNESFALGDSFLGSPRGQQLRYLLPFQISETAPITLDDRKNKESKKDPLCFWIIPTTTHFLCRKDGINTVSFSDVKLDKKVIYVWFSTHPNQHEILRLTALVGALKNIPCNYSIFPLKCQKSQQKSQQKSKKNPGEQ